jgi:hypothetical protein
MVTEVISAAAVAADSRRPSAQQAAMNEADERHRLCLLFDFLPGTRRSP